MPQPVRTALAFLAGFFAMIFMVIACTLACVHAFHLRSGHPTTPYLVVNCVYSLLAAMLGGWVAARLARSSATLAVGALAAWSLLLGVYGAFKPSPGQTVGYLLLSTALSVAGILWGGRLGRRAA